MYFAGIILVYGRYGHWSVFLVSWFGKYLEKLHLYNFCLKYVVVIHIIIPPYIYLGTEKKKNATFNIMKDIKWYTAVLK